MFCRYCGTELEQDAKFCTNCGRPAGKRREEMQEKTVQRQPGTGRQESPYTAMPAYGENRPVQKKKRKGFTWNKLLALAAALIILIAPQMAGYSASGFGVSYQASIHAFFQEDDALMLLYVPFLIGAAVMLLLQFFNHPKISLIGVVILTFWVIVVDYCMIDALNRYGLDSYVGLGAGCYVLIAGAVIAWVAALIPPRAVAGGKKDKNFY